MKSKKVIALLLSLLIMISVFPVHTSYADECSHNWVDGYCAGCDSYCNHYDYENSACAVCGMPCPHSYFYGGACQDCGKVCTHDTYNGDCLICDYCCEHQFGEDYICTVCGTLCPHSFYNGECQDCGYRCSPHDWYYGECRICRTYCGHDEEELNNVPCEICGMRCDHSFGNTFTCEYCGYVRCIHQWTDNNGNKQCIKCQMFCSHTYNGGTCTSCGLVCENHTYSGSSSICTNCHFQCLHMFENNNCIYCRLDKKTTQIWQGDIAHEFAGGTGSKEDPYRISTPEQLAYLAKCVRNGNDFTYGTDTPKPYYIVLTADIDLNNLDFKSIGKTSNQGEGYYFAGHFDGQGYTIKNFYTTSQGLFGGTGCWLDYTTSDCGRILNLNVIGEVNAIGYERDVGGIVGRAQGGYIENCTFTGTVTVTKTTYQFYGGIVGEMEQGEINNCIADLTLTVTGGQARGVGGILGGAEYNAPSLNNCANKGDVSAAYALDVGAIAGSYTKITNCYNTGAAAKFAASCRGYDTTGIHNSFDASNIQNGIVYMNDGSENVVLPAGELLATLNAWVEENENAWASASGTGYSAWKMGAGTPVFANEEVVSTPPELTLEVFTWTTDANNQFSGQVNMNGLTNIFAVGETITLTAVYNGDDYRFIGWYADGDFSNVFADTKVLYITVTEEMAAKETLSLTAMYEKVADVSIAVNISGSASTFKINGSEQTSGYTYSFAPGTVITIELTDTENFAYLEVNGKIVSRAPVYTFTAVNAITIDAVYNTKLENKKIVIFESAYGQIIQRTQMTLAELENAVLPAVPVKAGYKAGTWGMTLEQIKAEFRKENVEVITVKPVYPEITDTATVTVVGGTISGTDSLTTGEYSLNTVVTLVADTAAGGMMFSHWADESGNIIGYNETYSFYLAGDTAITAVFADNAQVIEKVGTANIIEVVKDIDNGKVSVIAMLTVPEGCSIDYAGIVASTNAEHANNLTAANAPIVRGNSSEMQALRYTWTAGNTAQKDIWVRAYLVYTDDTVNAHTVYSDIIEINYSAN